MELARSHGDYFLIFLRSCHALLFTSGVCSYMYMCVVGHIHAIVILRKDSLLDGIGSLFLPCGFGE